MQHALVCLPGELVLGAFLALGCAVVASGGGIGVIPCAVVEQHPEIVRVFPDPVAFTASGLVYHESARDTARVRAAIDVLAEVLEANRRLFSGRPE